MATTGGPQLATTGYFSMATDTGATLNGTVSPVEFNPECTVPPRNVMNCRLLVLRL